MAVEAKVLGIPDVRAALMGVVPKLRVRALRNALSAGARLVRDEARRATPVLAAPIRRKGIVIRKPGTLRKAISVRTSKIARRRGDVGVFVNVRPAKRGARGANMPDDPFYWRFVEFGTKFAAARPFLTVGAKRLGDALQVFIAKIGPAIDKVNKGQTP
jgi:HK97 gp10 family phage protein